MLIPYSLTPQVTALEYSEQRDLMKHPEKAEKYKALVELRARLGRSAERRVKRKKG